MNENINLNNLTAARFKEYTINHPSGIVFTPDGGMLYNGDIYEVTVNFNTYDEESIAIALAHQLINLIATNCSGLSREFKMGLMQTTFVMGFEPSTKGSVRYVTTGTASNMIVLVDRESKTAKVTIRGTFETLAPEVFRKEYTLYD